MNGRYEKIVLEAKKGIIFDVREGENGELIIKALNNKSLISYDGDYKNPPIPNGYKYFDGEWNDGFVIERQSDGSQFVWIPVGSLDSDGTLDGEEFVEKFGRRNYRNNEFSENRYHEEFTDELSEQVESIKKYGGFYISRYNISKSADGRPQSVQNEFSWVDVNFNEALQLAADMESTEQVKSHLVFGAEYDSILAWFIKSEARTLEEISGDSSNWGNYWNYITAIRQITRTGSSLDWSTNNIFDLAGNINEWTQEKNGQGFRVVRGGMYAYNGDYCPVAYRTYHEENYKYFITGFRVALCIK